MSLTKNSQQIIYLLDIGLRAMQHGRCIVHHLVGPIDYAHITAVLRAGVTHSNILYVNLGPASPSDQTICNGKSPAILTDYGDVRHRI